MNKPTIVKLFCILISLFSFSSCAKQKTTITGNTYWYYNKFVGNKPDAGSEIYLFSEDTTMPVLKGVCDVQGNFQIENVDVGKYVVVAESKNTNSSSPDIVMELIKGSKSLGLDLFKIDSSLLNLTIDFGTKADIYKLGPLPTLDYKEQLKYYDTAANIRKLANYYADSLLKKIPSDCRLKKKHSTSRVP